MVKAWFLINKKTGMPVDRIVPCKTKKEVLQAIAYDRYFFNLRKKILNENGYVREILMYPPENMKYYKFVMKGCSNESENALCEALGVSYLYIFQEKKFEKDVWKPYFEKYYEVKECKYKIKLC